MRFHEPAPPSHTPLWLSHYLANVEAQTKNRPSLHLEGTIVSVTPRPEGRLQLVLTNLFPVAQPGQEEQAPARADGVEAYTGMVLWSGDAMATLPVPGQTLRAAMHLAPERGFKNLHTWDIEQYRHDQGILLRARTKSKTQEALLGTGTPLPQQRNTLYSKVRQLLPYFTFAVPAAKDDVVLHNTQGMKTSSRMTQGGALLLALLFGDRSEITLQNTERINKSTLAHSLALSGLHLGYALMLGYGAARVLSFFRPCLLERVPRPFLAFACALPFALLYLWLGDAPISLQRAFLMFLCACPFLWAAKRTLLDVLLLAVFILLLFHPISLFDLRLQLSAASIAAIALFLPHARQKMALWQSNHQLSCAPTALQRIGRSVAHGAFYLLFTSVSIQVVLLPLLLQSFGTMGVWLPLNMLWLPILGTVVMPLAFMGIFCTAVSLPSLGVWCFSLAAIPCEALLHVLAAMDSAHILYSPLLPRPHWLLMMGYWSLCLALLVFGRRCWQKPPGSIVSRPQLAFLASVLCCGAGFVLALPSKWVTVDVFDVGAAQSVAITWNTPKGSGRALLDGGIKYPAGFDMGKSMVTPALTYGAWPRLDAVINSHADADHLGGLVSIISHFQVERIYKTDDTATPWLEQEWEQAVNSAKKTPEVVAQGDVIYLADNLWLEVLWPPPVNNTSAIASDTNDFAEPAGDLAKKQGSAERNRHCLLLRLVWNNSPLALFTGDVSGEELYTVLRGEHALTAPLLILPHHGSDTSFFPALYTTVQPQFAIASCRFIPGSTGAGQKVEKYLQELRIPLLTTAKNGQVRFVFTEGGSTPAVTTARRATQP